MRIYTIIVDETDEQPYLHGKAFKTYDEAREAVDNLVVDYTKSHAKAYENGLEYDEDEFVVYFGEFPMIQYHIEYADLD